MVSMACVEADGFVERTILLLCNTSIVFLSHLTGTGREQQQDAKKRKAADEKALKEALEKESAQRKHIESLVSPVCAALEVSSGSLSH